MLASRRRCIRFCYWTYKQRHKSKYLYHSQEHLEQAIAQIQKQQGSLLFIGSILEPCEDGTYLSREPCKDKTEPQTQAARAPTPLFQAHVTAFVSQELANRRFVCTATMPQVFHHIEDEKSKEEDVVEEGENQDCIQELNLGTLQLKDAYSIKSLCKVMENQDWGPNAEALLKHYGKDISPAIVSRVILQQKSLDSAARFFQWASSVIEKDVTIYHALLLKLGDAAQFDEMWRLVADMRQSGCQVNVTTFSIIIKAYGKAGMAKEALGILSKAHEFDVPLDKHIYTTLLNVLFKAKMVDQARHIYKQMLHKNCIFDGSAWATIIRGFAKNHHVQEAERCWNQMLMSGCEPDVAIYNAFIEGLCECKALNKALFALAALQEKGLKPNAYTYNPLLGVLCKMGRLAVAFNMFLSMRDTCSPNQATCNILLEGLFAGKDVSKALELFALMEEEDWVDSRSYHLLAFGLRRANETETLVSLSQKLFLKYGKVNVRICNAILCSFCADNNLNKAVSFFQKMENGLTQLDVASYATMINCYCKAGKVDEAMNLLCKMDGSACKPNLFCYTPIIAAALKADKLLDATKLFNEMVRSGLDTNAVTCDFLLRKLSAAEMVDEVVHLTKHIIDKKFQVHHVTLNLLKECLEKAGKPELTTSIKAMQKK